MSQLQKPSKWLKKIGQSARLWNQLTILIALLAGGCIILQAYSLAVFIQHVYIQKQLLTQNIIWLLYLGLAFLGRAILNGLKQIISFQIGSVVRGEVRKKLLHVLFNLSNKSENNNFSASDINTLAIEQTEALQNYFARYKPQMVYATLFPIILLLIIWPYNWLSGLILLITAPLIPLFMALVGMGAASLNRKNFKELAHLGAQFLDSIKGLATLKLFNAQHIRTQRLSRSSERYRIKTMEVLRVAFLSSGVLEFFSSIAIALIATCLGLTLLGYLDWGTYGTHLNLFIALFILLLAPEFYLPLKELGVYYHDRAEAIGAAEGLINIINTNSPNINAQNINPQSQKINLYFNSKFKSKSFEIKLENFNFKYPNSKDFILKNINQIIKPSQCIALIGPSGSGKSTVLNCLMGLNKLSQNQIVINHLDIFDFSDQDLKHFQSNISWLGQFPKLLPVSIKDNLKIAKPNATDEEIWNVCKWAKIDEFIQSLPDQLDTQMTEGAKTISGGQAQRIALARAFLRNGKIMILDEPTASLDEDHHQSIMAAVFKWVKHTGASLILSTHHLQTLDQFPFDAVWTLENGEIKS